MARVYGTVFERFLAKIRVSDTLSWNGTPCWIWTDRPNHKGYGTLSVKGKHRFAHRLSHEIFKGPIPAGMQPDHLCRIRNCENPDHLEAVTPYENFLRGQGRAAGFLIGERQKAKTHCPRGHEYTPGNTLVRTHGGRRPNRTCKACASMKAKENYAKRSRYRTADGDRCIDNAGHK